MTREEQIKKQAHKITESYHPLVAYANINMFIKGAQWADKNPKSPWISVDEDLPCNHEELIIHEPLYKRTKSVVCNKPCGIRVDQMVYDMSFNEWYWTGETPTHWFLAPELPKE